MSYTVSRTVYRDYEAERRREGTLAHVMRGWMPADAETLPRLFEKIDSREWDTPLLIQELKSDLAICARVVSKLRPSANSGGAFVSPLDDLNSMSPQQIAELLPASTLQVSKHRLDRASSTMKSLLACSVTCSAASEAFASEAAKRGVSVQGNDAFSCSLLRQLGLNLLAWNYPTLYLRVARIVRSSPSDSDGIFRRSFGFTPLTLGAECARRWNLTPLLRNALEEGVANGPQNSLREICEFGETFGKRQHKALYPHAMKEWEARKERLQELIGTSNIREIEEQVESHLESRLKKLFEDRPKQLNLAFSKARPTTAKSVWIENRYLKLLPDEISREYEPIYEELKKDDASISALMALTNRAIPASGFQRGLVCIADAKSDELRPIIRIGFEGEDERALQSLIATATEAKDSVVALMKTEGTSQTRVSSAFGTSKHRGVLVLERKRMESDSSIPDMSVLLFKAARTCLEQCLA